MDSRRLPGRLSRVLALCFQPHGLGPRAAAARCHGGQVMAGKRKHRVEQPPDSVDGDVFLVVNTDGLVWDGRGWVIRWQDGKHFVEFIDCEAVVARLRAGGAKCMASYVSSARYRARERERDQML